MNKKIFGFTFVITLFLIIFASGSFFLPHALAEGPEVPEVPETPEVPEVPEIPEDIIPTVTFIIRNGETVLYHDSVELPAVGTISINDSSGVSHDINAQSVLAVIKTIDDGSDTFSISNLQYFESFGAFFLKCILPNGGEDLCDNWQYAVGNVTPASSIDSTLLSGGETVGIYFGTTRRLVLSTDTVIAGTQLTATTEKYDYESDTWNPLTEVSVGVTLPNPDDPWNPIVISTHLVDDTGNANITITDANTYTLGIVEDFYFPSYTVTVTTQEPESGGGGSGGGNGGSSGNSITTPPPTFSISNAVSYLKSVQNPDGSFGNSEMYTDWATIAYSAADVTGNPRNSILTYLESHNTISSSLTENERRAMTLLALGKDPYSFHGINYIEAIIDEFDGNQFGDDNLVNDDIFALMPLANAGYDENDEEIAKAILFIISKQKTNGSWEDSIDVTAAAIQALKSFDSADGVSDSISLAQTYLKDLQESNGGWGNISSTSWVMQAQSVLGVSWEKNGKNGLDYLATKQTDANNVGSVLSASETLENNIWNTSYAIAAASDKPWSEILKSVSRPANRNSSSDSDNSFTDAEAAEEELADNTLPEEESEPLKLTPSDISLARADITSLPESKKISSVTKEKIAEEIEIENKEEAPKTLTASAIDALPEEKTSSNLPIVLGTISVFTILGLVVKFWIL